MYKRCSDEKIIVGLPLRSMEDARSKFVEFSKMIYLDGDIQVFDNIDHLFDLPDGYFYAVMDCFSEKTWSRTPQYKLGYCQQCPNKVYWAEEELGYFNAGMFVFEPNMSTYHDLLDKLKVTTPTSFAEQVKPLFILLNFLPL